MSEPRDTFVRPRSMGVGERVSTFGAKLEALGQTPTQFEIRFVGDMERLTIGPDDRFVLTMDHPASADIHERIQAVWASFAGEGVPLLILEKGMKLGAINVKVEPA